MATSTLGSGTLVLAGTTSGTTTVTATAVAGTTTLTLPAATDTLVGKATTDTLTNKTLTGAVMNGTLGATTPSTVAATTLTTSSTVTHNGGTANGVAYLNGSKVLTTGSALTYDGTNFATTGNATLGGASKATDTQLNFSADTGTQRIYIERGSRSLVFYDVTTAIENYRIAGITGAQTWTVGGTRSMDLTSTGLGIGTSSPISKLQISTSGNTVTDTTSTGTGYVVTRYNTSTNYFFTGINDGANTAFPSAAYANLVWGTGAYPIVFATNNGEKMRLDSSGNLLVNTTSAVTTTVGSRLMYGATDPYISSTLTSSSDATTSYLLYSTGAGAYRFYVGLGGTIFATSIVITAISDQRLKENIRDIDAGLDEIMALKPRRFDWKEGKGQDKKNVAGFIAQEFEDVFPECVSTSKAGEDGIEYKNINHETLIPTLVKAIQELKAEFDAYKTSHP